VRHLQFASTGGASGDMMLSVLVDLGVSVDVLRERLRTLDIGDFEIKAEAVDHHSLSGTRVTVVPAPGDEPHRHLKDIREIIIRADLPENSKVLATQVFERLAVAEATVHQTTPEKIHFHEVGAVDSVVDIVGSCLGLSLLEIDTVNCGALPIGCGHVTCDHGRLPVPVPAVIELLKGYEVEQTDEPFELVTPTGAALLTTWLREKPTASSGRPAVLVDKGIGFGQRELKSRINVLRATLTESSESPVSASATPTSCTVLETNLDDMNPELVGSLTEALMAAGALDVFVTPIQMKKQRPGSLLSVICRPEDKPLLVDILFRQSSSFGVREYDVTRTVLERRHETVQTPYGPIRIKIGTWQGDDVTTAPEHADCVKAAAEHGVAVRQAYEAAVRGGWA
jgi:uncharacterized protein (TIGR00299 family) protein